MTTAEVARYLRIGPDRVRSLIQSGQLRAINTSPHRCRRPRYVVLPHHLAEFERGRQAVTPPTPARQKKRTQMVDFYPD
jgi:excisionase family DNA binding protein